MTTSTPHAVAPAASPAPHGLGFAGVLALFLRAWPYVAPVWFHVLAYVTVELFAYVFGAFFGFVTFGLIYNNVISSAPVGSIAALLLGLDPATWVEVAQLTQAQRGDLVAGVVVLAVVSTAIGAAMGHLNSYYRVWILQAINQHLRVTMLAQLQALSLRFHADARPGDSMYRLFQDSAMVTQFLEALIVVPFLAGLRFLLGVAVVAAFSPTLALALALAWLPVLLLARLRSAGLRQGFERAREGNAALTSTIQETLEGMRTIKANGLEAARQRTFEVNSAAAFEAAAAARTRLLGYGFLAFVAGAIPLATVELWAALLASDGRATFLRDLLLGFGFAAWNLGAQDQARARARQTIGSLEALALLWGRAQDMAMGLARVYRLLDLTPDVRNRPGAVPFTGARSHIAFIDVGFGYGERRVFDGLQFEARAGEVTAILGPTGRGKSTLLALLLRLLDVQRGSIAIDGRDIRGFTFESLRAAMTLSTQENLLVAGTVADNIRYARPAASDDEVRAAACVACADEFIERLPQGYATPLGERAARLSTGQRQRLVLARALLKDTPILLLDEPTAALDVVTERKVLANLRAWSKGRTVLLVTHRLTTARAADSVVYLRKDGGVDSGSHDALMAMPGAYRAFVLADGGAAVGSAAMGSD